EDEGAEEAAGIYNRLGAAGTSPDVGGGHWVDALDGLGIAIDWLELEEADLARSLLVREVGVAVDRVFANLSGPAGERDASNFGRLGAIGLPCVSVACCRRSRPQESEPVARRRCADRCSDCCDDCCCCDACDACDTCGDCASCCDCSC